MIIYFVLHKIEVDNICKNVYKYTSLYYSYI